MRIARVPVMVLILVVLLVAGGCSARNQGADTDLEPVIGAGASVTTLPPFTAPLGGEGGVDAASLEAAFTVYVACLEEAGFHGFIHFDLSLSASAIQDIDMGPPDDGAAEQRLLACLRPFEAAIDIYAQTHPKTPSQFETIRQGFLACGERYFPSQIDSDGSYDEVLRSYNNLGIALATASEHIPGVKDCADIAMAGPPRPFGK